MKLLFDENLSRKLVPRLASLYPGSTHVAEAGLMQSRDAAVWDFAKANGFTVVTTDSDFYDLVTAYGPPPKVIWLRQWIHPTKDAEALLRRESIRIAEFGKDSDSGVLVLDLASSTRRH